MELRNHPFMFCDGVRRWPPTWLQTFGPTARSVTGEVGILDAVFLSKIIPPDKVYLVIKTEGGNGYLGILTFENASAAKIIFDLLYKNVRLPITAIGALDIPLEEIDLI
jgi:hypothetical protein